MKIASFESLEFLFSKNRKNHFCLTFEDSPLHKLNSANYKKNKILRMEALDKKDLLDLWPDEEDLMRHTNIGHLLSKNKIEVLQLDTKSSDFCERWAKSHSVKLIATRWKFQKKYENKIYFDRFLEKNDLPKPESIILKSKEDYKRIRSFPVVIQIPESNGSKGTFFIKSRADLKKIKDVEYPLLCREFIEDGLPLGVSIIIGREEMIFSSLRVQAYFPGKKGGPYYGIQWIKTSFLSPKTVSHINEVLLKIGKSMQKDGFLGVANFDFILKRGEIFFIECNPRLGGSTPQLSLKNELLHGLDFVNEMTLAVSGKKLTKNCPFLPNSKYEGFNLDMDYIAHQFYGKKALLPESGFYKNKINAIEFVSYLRKSFDTKEIMFIYNPRKEDSIIDKDTFLGFVIFNFPLMKISRNGYCFTERGETLLGKMENFINP